MFGQTYIHFGNLDVYHNMKNKSKFNKSVLTYASIIFISTIIVAIISYIHLDILKYIFIQHRAQRGAFEKCNMIFSSFGFRSNNK